MKKFQIEIEEKLQHVYEVEADSLIEALSIAKQRYHSQEYELDANDLQVTSFREYKDEVIKQKNKKDRER